MPEKEPPSQHVFLTRSIAPLLLLASMLVMKFGGSSVADAKQIQKVFEIVKGREARTPLVVVSAHKGVTDMLINAARAAASGKADASAIVDRQRKVLEELSLEPSMLDGFFGELEDVLRGISLVREASPRVLDFVQSFGERMSARAIAAAFARRGMNAQAFDAFDLGFVTNEVFGTARPVKGYEHLMRTAYNDRVKPGMVPIVTGFVGKTAKGEITTVGRNGSDYTATVFAAALGAEECEIWTDTDGVMTADPSLIPSARTISRMSFAEASELAQYGGRVLHPSTLLPAVEKNVPVRVLNTNRPDHPGTVITADGGPPTGPITSIAYKERQWVITIENPTMLGQHGFLARVFEIMGRLQVDVDMISTSHISVSMTTPVLKNLDEVVEALSQHGRVTVAKEKTIVSIVGRNVKHQTGLGARIFGSLRDAGVNVEMVSHGANNINIGLLIDDAEIGKAVKSLHGELFAGSTDTSAS
jgi:aspartate kinase